jgi:hypothetical protein
MLHNNFLGACAKTDFTQYYQTETDKKKDLFNGFIFRQI